MCLSAARKGLQGHENVHSVTAGDTGLLDHLLKHLADKIVTAEGDKLRRRHNAEGHMEYWLQSSSNANAGIFLPYLMLHDPNCEAYQLPLQLRVWMAWKSCKML